MTPRISWPDAWPPGVRALASAAVDAVRAVDADDRDALAESMSDLAPFGDLTGRLHAETLRSVLEEFHPSGIEGDDVAELVQGIRARHPQWAIDHVTLTIVVLGALGVDIDTAAASAGDSQDPDDRVPLPPLSDEVSARYASLVLAQLTDERGLRRHLLGAITEIARADTVEMP